MRFDDLTRDRETKSDARGSRGEERLEDAATQIGGDDARSRVRNRQVNLAAVRPRLEPDLAARWHRLDRVVNEPDQHLRNQIQIDVRVDGIDLAPRRILDSNLLGGNSSLVALGTRSNNSAI